MASKARTSNLALYKILCDGCSIHGGDMEWSLPTADGPGDWHAVEGDLVRCKNGLHLTADPSRRWSGSRWDPVPECYLVETEGEVLHEPAWGDEYVARKVRLVRRLSWAELAALGITPPDGAGLVATKKRAPPQPKPGAGPSPALTFVRHAWESRCEATPHSWSTINATMRATLMLAVTGGMSFAKGDFAEIYRSMRGGYWFGESGEGYYSAACEAGNLQACASFEEWTGRKPFMWEGSRLHVGRRLTWEGLDVKVTSFQDDKGHLTACSYTYDGRGRDIKIERRFTITREALARAEKDRKTLAVIERDSTVVHKEVLACGLDIAIESVTDWTPEERETALQWAREAKHDAGKSRVKPPPPPAFLVAAVSARDERQRAARVAEAQERLDDARHARQRAEERVRWFEETLAQLKAGEATTP